MTTTLSSDITNPTDGSLGFSMKDFTSDAGFNEVQKIGLFSIIWILEGNGSLKADFTAYDLVPGSMLFFMPFQPFQIKGADLKGIILNFHHDFFCIIKHHREIACDGILFNNINQSPLVNIPAHEAPMLQQILEQVKRELQVAGLAQHDLITSYLKILLINVTRIKLAQDTVQHPFSEKNTESVLLHSFRSYIDQHFREKHSAGDYADLLHTSVKNLGRIVKEYYQKTPTDMIAMRIIIEAKRELYLTDKPIKEIAYELGFKDEYHFSRYFKNITATSPQTYRNSLNKAWG
jgi:AraC family transcriptional regulator, transcriptional activator of pobA